MSFNEGNYRRLRAHLLTLEGKFDWMRPAQYLPDEAACISCACVFLETGQLRNASWNGFTGPSYGSDIQRFIGCTPDEARWLWVPQGNALNDDVYAAVSALDEVAARYGVTPDAAPVFTGNPDAFLAELRSLARETVNS